MDRISLGRYLLFAAPAIAGCALDLGSKAWLFAQPALRAGEILWIWVGHIGIQLSWNEGALFGIGQGHVWLFAALSIAAAAAIPVWLFWFGMARDGWLTFALGCVMAGVLGNLYDRLGLHGEVWPPGHPRAGEPIHAVRDWVLWQINDQWRWPNFNLADSMLVVGAALLLLHALRRPVSPQPDERAHVAAPKTPS
jgi:signal peptidase II